MKLNCLSKSLKTSLLCGVAVSGFAATPTFAQDAAQADNSGTDVVVVTARKKNETLVEVPMNITAVGSAEISARNLVDTSELFRTVAGAGFPQNSFRSQVILRGLSGGNDSTPDTTSVFYDGVPYDFGDLFDVERVEILRGPQGTLWGSNAIGGTVQVITKKPVMNEIRVIGSLQASHEKNRRGLSTRANLALNLPIVDDKLAFRMTGMTEYTPSKYFNAYNGTYGYDRDHYIRTQLLWDANEDLSINLGFIHSKEYTIGNRYADRSTPNGYYTMNLTADETEPYGWAVSDDFTACGAGEERWQCRQSAETVHSDDLNPRFTFWELLDNSEERETNMGTLNVEHENIADFMRMSYVGSYRRTTDSGLDNWSRLDGNDLFRTWIINRNAGSDAGKRMTHELRFNSIDEDSPIQWTIGAFYDKRTGGNVPDLQYQYHQGDDAGQTYAKALYWWGVDASAVGQDLYGDPNKNYNINQIDEWEKEFAIFGEVSYIADLGNGGEIEFTAGTRYFETSNFEHVIESGIWVGPEASVTNDGSKATGTREKFSISYRPNEDLSVYALYAEGYRPGGFNMPSLPVSCRDDANAVFFNSQYESDEIKNYEVGAKGALFDRKVRFSAAVYRIDWDGIQSSIYMPTCGFSFTGNAVAARTEGFEIETNTSVTDTVSLVANFSYTDSKLTVDAPSIQGEAGDDMTMVPDYNAYVAVQKDFDLYGRPAFVRVGATAYGESKSHFNVKPEDISDSYAVVDLRMSMEATENVTVSLHVHNLFNKDYTTYKRARSRGDSTQAALYHYYGRERTVTLRADFDF